MKQSSVLGASATSHYSDVRPGDPEVMVKVVVENGHTATGFIDARQLHGDVWEAYVDYSYIADNGDPSHRRDWFPMDDLTVLTIDDVPQGDYVISPRSPRQVAIASGRPLRDWPFLVNSRPRSRTVPRADPIQRRGKHLMRLLVRFAMPLALLIAGLTSPLASASGTDEMTPEQAGTYYLSSVCKSNTADRRFEYAMYRGQGSVTRRQARNRLPAIHRTAIAASAADYEFARALKNPPAPWPASVQAPVSALAAKELRLEWLYSHVAAAGTVSGVFYWDNRVADTYNAGLIPARAIRATLNLSLTSGQSC